ncbi:hypothetical protein GCM10007094_13210 [Pseudovibrio japonicus]|uniref:Uncharacterized protein n=1 Tax=Pseudovibrio japonicus TaxID=366534 RepID=A0ABQ3E8U2_9HYPH|nr:hypothetical protein [Pseudovibrio japonicus]GHB26332.1 hypothetical protein GCM10007094_13210 [Pseudovibrio japonicus]
MTTTIDSTEIARHELNIIRAFFLISALWNFAGAFPGLLDSAGMFEREFGRELVDPVMIAVYRGAWGTALLYGFGFLAVAYNPMRHTVVVMMGGLGKALFALNLGVMYLNGWTSEFALVVIGGDVVFVLLFVIYFLRLRYHGHALI